MPWPDSVVDVPFEPKHMGMGVGAGEERLAKMFGCQVMGGLVAYDLIDKEGKTWEVKEPSSPTGELRTGVDGRAAVQDVFDEIKRTVKRIDDVFVNATARTFKVMQAAESIMHPDDFKKARDFCAEEAPMIMKGELSHTRSKKLAEIIDTIGKYTLNSETSEQRLVAQVDIKHGPDKLSWTVGPETYAEILMMFDDDASKQALKKLPREVVKNAFKFAAFHSSGQSVIDAWFKSVRASDVFGHTDGVILVLSEGYRIVLKENLNDVFTFSRITKGIPHFKVRSPADM